MSFTRAGHCGAAVGRVEEKAGPSRPGLFNYRLRSWLAALARSYSLRADPSKNILDPLHGLFTYYGDTQQIFRFAPAQIFNGMDSCEKQRI